MTPAAPPAVPPFRWRDGERLVRFGRGVAAEAVELLGGPGFTLLTTPRAAAAAPHVVEAAAVVHEVPRGQVDALAGELLAAGVGGERLVALGGGRVVDVAKALAAAAAASHARGTATRALAVPTTLSGAEMTSGHRHARGIDRGTPRVRPAVVVHDPALSATQPLPELAASAANALGHAAEAPCVHGANPVASLAAHEAARLLAGGLRGTGSEPDREALALGALLAGYAVGATGLGLHHVLAQSLARFAGAGHGPANAAMLPHSLRALAWRFPAEHDRLAEAMGEDPGEVATRLAGLAGASRLRELGVEAANLPRCADAAAERPELDATPPRADRAEVLALYESAY